MTWVWLDGKYLPEEKALIPATDPGFLHGRGLFEVLRGYEGGTFRLDDHLARMAASARRFALPFRPPPLAPVIRELCRRNRVPDAYVRLTLSALGHLLVLARPRTPPRGTRIRFAPWVRDPRAPISGHKTLSYFENVLGHEQAVAGGYADLIVHDPDGWVLEGCVTNVFTVTRGRIATPPVQRGVLPGVARKVVLELEKVAERKIHMQELGDADEVFLTNSLIEVLPAGRPGPVARRVAAAYREAVSRSLAARSSAR